MDCLLIYWSSILHMQVALSFDIFPIFPKLQQWPQSHWDVGARCALLNVGEFTLAKQGMLGDTIEWTDRQEGKRTSPQRGLGPLHCKSKRVNLLAFYDQIHHKRLFITTVQVSGSFHAQISPGDKLFPLSCIVHCT
jgi:hypothetical protein